MQKSDSIANLATALAKAQSEMAGAKKDANNPHYKSKYADLASVWDAARPALTKHELSIAQFTEPTDKDEIRVCTMLMHSSGEWLSGDIAIPVDKANAHGYGSALTYARRYALAAAVGIAPEDDDGNAAAQAPAKASTAPPNGSARRVATDALDALTPAEKETILRKAQHVEELNAAKGIVTAVQALHDMNLDTEGKLAIWACFDSSLRSSIKREEERLRQLEKEPA